MGVLSFAQTRGVGKLKGSSDAGEWYPVAEQHGIDRNIALYLPWMQAPAAAVCEATDAMSALRLPEQGD